MYQYKHTANHFPSKVPKLQLSGNLRCETCHFVPCSITILNLSPLKCEGILVTNLFTGKNHCPLDINNIIYHEQRDFIWLFMIPVN